MTLPQRALAAAGRKEPDDPQGPSRLSFTPSMAGRGGAELLRNCLSTHFGRVLQGLHSARPSHMVRGENEGTRGREGGRKERRVDKVVEYMWRGGVIQKSQGVQDVGFDTF